MAGDKARWDVWTSGDLYEPYVGRWSRLVAKEFVDWLEVRANCRWLDVGCGTGALSQTILASASPAQVKGIDRSEGQVEYARGMVNDPRAEFEVGNAQKLPVTDNSFEAAVSGLVLNFVPDPEKMVSEMKRAVGENGMVALYVWDYAGRMQMMRYFWDAAQALDPAARELNAGQRFPICNPQPLSELFQKGGLKRVETRAIDVETRFRDFDDYWNPFLSGHSPAPSYCMSLSEEGRAQLREQLRADLPIASDGSISLVARAWAVRGIK